MVANARLLVFFSLVTSFVALGGCSTPPSNPPSDGTVSDDGGGTGCQSDSNCSGATPRCDRNSGKCQPCLPANDNCASGSHCIPMNDGFVCSAACRTDADCPKGDGGEALTCCTGSCIDVNADTKNCAACGRACPGIMNGTAACAAGVCVVGACDSGFADCDKSAQSGCEVSTKADAKNCGGCGMACSAGLNSTATCSNSSCGLECTSGFADCDGNAGTGCEVAVFTDVSNCGGCAQACGGLPNATVGCGAGACVITACNSGYSDCDNDAKNGCEVNKLSDTANCGACGKMCSFPNAATTCQSGTCVLGACDAGFANCDGIAANGCETPTSSDSKNCGGCGRMCAGTNSTQQCVSGACAVASCTTGYADCDGLAQNGCEAQVSTDVGNCGGCGKMCPVPANATATCSNGTCGVGACKFGFEDCDKNPANGCEANLLSTANCGFCGNTCSAPTNATAGCNAGQCGIGTCNALWGNCDNNTANGCEKSLATDLNNCGACGNVCSLAHATPVCLGGQCGISSCSAGFSDCDNDAATGCEAPTSSDVMNCGGCGKVCPGANNATPTCTSSTCGLSCTAGYANCDGASTNGCEINTRTDVSNCGTCGKVCGVIANGTPGCASGACGVGSCTTNFADCNKVVSDGCEVNIATSLANCGMCGKACSFTNAQAACLGGQCGFVACNTGFADCDNNLANGCEKSTQSDPNNCGGCGVVCGAAKPNCVAGTCTNLPPASCKAAKAANSAATSGVYTIDPDGAGALTAYQVYCDMTTDGGGWTLVAVFTNGDGVQNWIPTSASWVDTSTFGTPTDPTVNADAKSRAFNDLAGDEIMVRKNSDTSPELETTTSCLVSNPMTWLFKRNSSSATSCAYSCGLKTAVYPWAGQSSQASRLNIRCMDTNGGTTTSNGYTISLDDDSFFTTLDNTYLDNNFGWGAGYANSATFVDFDGTIDDGPDPSDTAQRLVFVR